MRYVKSAQPVAEHFSLSKKPRRVCRRWRQIESNPFSAGACTWQKTLLRLQVWNLSPIGGQIMRAAGCQSLSEKPKGVFRQSQVLSLWLSTFYSSSASSGTASKGGVKTHLA